VFDQREELPLLPFGNPIGFVPDSKGGVYIELIYFPLHFLRCQGKNIIKCLIGCSEIK
jgi:hypothetical protein